jgi:hypothetical protein
LYRDKDPWSCSVISEQLRNLKQTGINSAARYYQTDCPNAWTAKLTLATDRLEAE